MANNERVFHEENIIPHARDGFHWVFGSNTAGRHGAGAARVARVNFHAEYGVGRGLTGMAYAIPTKDKSLKVLPLVDVEANVAEFLDYARAHPAKRFFVTAVGTGPAGYSDDEIGPLFADAPLNCSLPWQWKQYSVSPAAIAVE